MLLPMDAGALVDLVAALEAGPELRPVLEAALELEAQPHPEPWIGWTWQEVRAAPHLLRRLLVQRWLTSPYHSNRATHYRLTDPDRVREALRVALGGGSDQAAAEASHELPADLFDVVEGLDDVRRKLRLALEAERPVHVLLLGPPASAKTVLLYEVGRLPGARLTLGGTTTRSGLVGYLLAEPATRYLVIDEIDKMGGSDLSGLLSVMETGLVTRLQHGHQETERRHVWVLAGANRVARLPPELLDRFLVIVLGRYGAEQLRQVVEAVLVRHEGVDPELAREIAKRAAAGPHSVRAAVRIARMARGRRRVAIELAEELL
jgi:Holliday junction DNA helicase RuvB